MWPRSVCLRTLDLHCFVCSFGSVTVSNVGNHRNRLVPAGTAITAFPLIEICFAQMPRISGMLDNGRLVTSTGNQLSLDTITRPPHYNIREGCHPSQVVTDGRDLPATGRNPKACSLTLGDYCLDFLSKFHTINITAIKESEIILPIDCPHHIVHPFSPLPIFHIVKAGSRNIAHFIAILRSIANITRVHHLPTYYRPRTSHPRRERPG